MELPIVSSVASLNLLSVSNTLQDAIRRRPEHDASVGALVSAADAQLLVGFEVECEGGGHVVAWKWQSRAFILVQL